MTFLLFSKKSSAASGGGVLRRHHANRASEFAARAGLAQTWQDWPRWGTLGSSPRASVSPTPPLFWDLGGRNSTEAAVGQRSVDAGTPLPD